MKYKKRILLLLILVLAAALRTYRINTVPPSLSLDEVSIGYNAYSILRTGRDEYGNFMPLLLRAYDDFRPALYVYTVVPFTAIFGLTPVAVRLPSLILSVITVYLTYLISREIFYEDERKENIALISAGLMAVSPWHIYISRLGHEANLGLTVTVSMVYFLFRTVNRKSLFDALILSVLTGVSLVTYQSQKLVTPVIIGAASLLFFTQIRLIKKLWIPVLVGVLMAGYAITISLTPDALIRFKGTSAFSHDSGYYQKRLQAYIAARERNDRLGTMVNSRYAVYLTVFANNYLSHFNPIWLFHGDYREDHKVPDLGLLFPWEFITVLAGLCWLIIAYPKKQKVIFILIWLLSSALPGAITTGAPHAMRSYTFLPVWQLLSATGLVQVMKLLERNKPYLKFFYAVAVITLTTSIWYFTGQYFRVFPDSQSDSFQYAMPAAITYINDHKTEYRNIVVSNSGNLYQSYMFYLFYSGIDPTSYIKSGGTVSGGYAEIHTIGNIQFRPILWNTELKDGKTLYVGNTADFPVEVVALKSFTLKNGQPAVKAAR